MSLWGALHIQTITATVDITLVCDNLPYLRRKFWKK
jgi:hypothetical protein